MQKHCETVQRTCRVVNLDPAAEYFEYTPSADVRDLIHVSFLHFPANIPLKG